MTSDLKDIERILKVQRQLHGLIRSRLHALSRQRETLESDQAALLDYLAESALMRHEPLLKSAHGRLRALSARQEDLEADIDRMTTTALHQERLMKIAEHRLAARLRERQREQERRELETALEVFMAKRYASLP